tara:strand:- start:347 stop:598 length:252 start_codon:yes stop_codon:yes gene_type:complete
MSDQEFKPLDLLPKEDIKIVLKQHSKRQLLEKALLWEMLAKEYKKQLENLQKDQASIDKERVEEFFKLNKDELQNEQDDKKKD